MLSIVRWVLFVVCVVFVCCLCVVCVLVAYCVFVAVICVACGVWFVVCCLVFDC